MLSKDKKKCNVLPYNKMQRDEDSQGLKFDLKEKNLRAISEVQNKNMDTLRENVLDHQQEDCNTELMDNTLLLPRSLHIRKDCYTKTKPWNVLFLMTLRFFLISVTLLLFGYNLVAYHNEFTVSNY